MHVLLLATFASAHFIRSRDTFVYLALEKSKDLSNFSLLFRLQITVNSPANVRLWEEKAKKEAEEHAKHHH